jgi:hypothetical protein
MCQPVFFQLASADEPLNAVVDLSKFPNLGCSAFEKQLVPHSVPPQKVLEITEKALILQVPALPTS